MKYVFFTDSHFHLFTNYAKPDEEYINDRFREQMKALEEVFEIARKNDAEVIFGGDLFHKRNNVDTKVYNHVMRVFSNNQDIKVHLLRGNHDSTSNSLYTYSSIEPFTNIENIKVYETPEFFQDDDVNIVFIPYGDETEDMKEFIKTGYKKDKGTNILVAHIGVDGATTGKGSHRLEGAFGYQDLMPDYYDFILLGHYHKRQELGGNPNHVYGGCLLQASFSDEGQDKGVYLIDTEEKTNTFIPLSTRKFITVTGDAVPDDIEEIVKEGHFVRFIGTPEQVKAVAIDNSEETSNVQVQLKKKYTVEKRIDSSVSDEPIAIASSYADKFFPDSKDEILECLKEVL